MIEDPIGLCKRIQSFDSDTRVLDICEFFMERVQALFYEAYAVVENDDERLVLVTTMMMSAVQIHYSLEGKLIGDYNPTRYVASLVAWAAETMPEFEKLRAKNASAAEPGKTTPSA